MTTDTVFFPESSGDDVEFGRPETAQSDATTQPRPASQPRRGNAVLYLAEALAAVVREVYRLEPPISIQSWLNRCGVGLEWRTGSLFEGRYLRTRDDAVIRILDRGDDRRRNFTAAHELGHHFLEELRVDPGIRRRLDWRSLEILARVEVGGRTEERICNAFAGALLIPYSVISTTLGGGLPTIDIMETVARSSRVTALTAAIRFAQHADDEFRFLTATPSVAGSWTVDCVVRSTTRSTVYRPSSVQLEFPQPPPWRGTCDARWHSQGQVRRVRLDVRCDHARWLRAVVLHGQTPFSPAPAPTPGTDGTA